VRKVASGVTTLYFYDAAGHVIASQNVASTPATRRSYVSVADEPMGAVDQPPSGAPVFSWIHTDRLGTPLAVTSTPGSGSAQVIWRAPYEPFGLATPEEDPDGDNQTFVLDLRFPGQVFDVDSGGHDNYWRTYDAATGSYLEADPIGQSGGINVYSYANNNPANAIDPTGLLWIYSQSSGNLSHIQTAPGPYAGTVTHYGGTSSCCTNSAGSVYSGYGRGLNDPGQQSLPGANAPAPKQNAGPIPRGKYTIGAQIQHPNLGPAAMRLTPSRSNNMFGRSDFWIHGDNSSLNFTASQGCIIAPRAVRDAIAASGDPNLLVVQ
jgi:RHS repeat-associated protein